MTQVPFEYLMQVSICMMFCYAIYHVAFKRLTFFSLNRFFLLFAVTACLVLPALHITINSQLPVNAVHEQVATLNTPVMEKEVVKPIATHNTATDWVLIAGITYLLVCAVLLCKLFYNIFKIIYQAKRNGVKSGANYIISEPTTANASFFNIIFLHKQGKDPLEVEQILAHERAHVNLYHSADKLYLQLIKVFFWFNPFVYLIYGDLNEVHEFQVDDLMKSNFNPQAYAHLLLKLSAMPKFSLANQLSAVALKSRIRMLFGTKSMAAKKWLYLLMVPLVCTMLYSFSVERVYGGAAFKKSFVLVLDAGHGGKDFGMTGVGWHTEKDMALLLVKQIKLAAEARGMRVILTRKDDSYLDMHNRGDNKADAFISIHMNATGEGLKDKKSHGTYVMLDPRQLDPLSKKLASDLKTSLEQLEGTNADHKVEIYQNQHLHILSQNNAPAVLIEMGYITNPQNVNYALSAEGQHSIANKIVDAVAAFGNSK